MSAGDVAAVIVSVAAVVAVALLAVVTLAATRTLRATRVAVEELRREATPVLVDLQRATRHANADLDRTDAILTSAESVGATMDSFSQLLYMVVSNPLIKALAVAAGTGRAARALRRGRR